MAPTTHKVQTNIFLSFSKVTVFNLFPFLFFKNMQDFEEKKIFLIRIKGIQRFLKCVFSRKTIFLTRNSELFLYFRLSLRVFRSHPNPRIFQIPLPSLRCEGGLTPMRLTVKSQSSDTVPARFQWHPKLPRPRQGDIEKTNAF